jgi:peroxiredoxin
MMTRLENGQRFPSLQLRKVGGGTVALPDDLAGDFGVVLVYRGSWCPYCNAQLASFSRAQEALEQAGAVSWPCPWTTRRRPRRSPTSCA